MFTLSRNRSKKEEELRIVVVETLQDMMKGNVQVVATEADLGGASGFIKIQKSNPDRFTQCGIPKASMTGAAVGLSVTGFKPYLHTLGSSVFRRTYDQIFLPGAYAGNIMNIYGSDPGSTAGPNGETHTTREDVALIRTIPRAVVCDVADEVQPDRIVREFAGMEGVHYIRANRKDVRNVYEEGSTFEMGKGNIVREGSDVLIISAGQLVSDALDCAEVLSEQGISAEVIDMLCIKLLDEELIIREVARKKAAVTFESHSIIDGLGSAVTEVLAENNISVKFRRHGVEERFGVVGIPEFLQEESRLAAEDLFQTVENTLK